MNIVHCKCIRKRTTPKSQYHPDMSLLEYFFGVKLKRCQMRLRRFNQVKVVDNVVTYQQYYWKIVRE